MFCSKCGAKVPDNVAFCTKCGASTRQGSIRGVIEKLNTNLAMAIFTTVCCCVPFGIVSIVYASKVTSLAEQGNIEAAKQNAAKAKKWAIAGVITGFIINSIWVLVEILVIVSER